LRQHARCLQKLPHSVSARAAPRHAIRRSPPPQLPPPHRTGPCRSLRAAPAGCIAAIDSILPNACQFPRAPSSSRRESIPAAPDSPVVLAKSSSSSPADSSNCEKCSLPSARPAPIALARPIPFPTSASLQSGGTNPALPATARTKTPAPPAFLRRLLLHEVLREAPPRFFPRAGYGIRADRKRAPL